MKKIIEYIPLISGCLLYFGFCHLYYYYKEFNIDIYSLISSTDILLSFFPTIVLVASVFSGAAFSQLYGTIRKSINEEDKDSQSQEDRIKKKRLEWWRRNIHWFIFLYYLLFNLLLYVIQKINEYKSFELYDWKLIIDSFFLFLIFIAILIHEKRSSILNQPTIIAFFLIIFIGQKMGIYRTYDAQMIKNGITNFKQEHLAFTYEGLTVKTNDSVMYIGSTSNYIFLYNKYDSSTNIYPLTETKFLTVK